jgi:hypothetical protein
MADPVVGTVASSSPASPKASAIFDMRIPPWRAPSDDRTARPSFVAKARARIQVLDAQVHLIRGDRSPTLECWCGFA